MTIIALTLIPQVPLGDTISGEMLKNTFADIRCRVESIELVQYAVLGLDASYNDFSQVAETDWVGSRSGWQPHAHGLVRINSRDDAENLKLALKELFPAIHGVPTPVFGRYYDGHAYWASYLMKSKFYRRASYIDKKTGTLNASNYDLTAEQDIKLMRALSDLGLAGRIALVGLKTSENMKTNKIGLTVTA